MSAKPIALSLWDGGLAYGKQTHYVKLMPLPRRKQHQKPWQGASGLKDRQEEVAVPTGVKFCS